MRVGGLALLAALAAGDVASSRVEAASAEAEKTAAESGAGAQSAATSAEIAALREMIEQQQRMIEAQQRQIDYLQQSLSEVRDTQAKAPLAQSGTQLPIVYRAPSEDAAKPASRPAAATRDLREEPTGAITLAQADTQGGRETVGERPPEEKKAPPELPAIADLGGVLTPRGTLSIEPSLTASHASTSRFLFRGVEILPSFLIGVIEVTEADRDYVSPSITARYGITNALEASVSVPYVYRSDSVTQSGASLGATSDQRDVEGHGIGDVEVGLQYQITRGNQDWPILVGNVRGKLPTGEGPFDVPRDPIKGLETELPTGSGFYSIQPSITVIRPMDPLVFYGNASYLFNLGRDINQSIPTAAGVAFIGNVDPGDAFGVSLGGALAITENVSVSLGYDHYYVFGTKQTASAFDESTSSFTTPVRTKGRPAQVGTLSFGVNVRGSRGKSFSITLGTGVTDEAQDVSITLRRPLSWHIGP